METKLSNAYLHLIVGPMFSGKSTALINEVEKLKLRKKSVVIIKHADDQRYTTENKLITHGKLDFPAIGATRIADVMSELENFDVIGIDEGQFFEDIKKVDELATNKIVIVNFLTGTFKRENFSLVEGLYPLADKITHLLAICDLCGTDAPFSKKISGGEQVVQIGGKESYLPVCRKCFLIN